MHRGYAVLDFETTGLSPKHGDRVVEVGIVAMTPDFQIEETLETLINPKRDVGPTRVHGITAKEILDAPTFDRVAPSVLALLEGRVIVGHNVSFDLRFLAAELEREGYDAPEFVHVDTMHISKKLLQANPPANFKLHVLAPHLGFHLPQVLAHAGLSDRPAHSALADAMVTGYLLGHLAQISSASRFWNTTLESAGAVEWPQFIPCDVTVKPRGTKTDHGSVNATFEFPEAKPDDLAIGSHLPLSGELGDRDQVKSIDDVFVALGTKVPQQSQTAMYAKLLDESLEDRVLTISEVDDLVETARTLGLDSVTLGSLHRGHFDGVVRAAWSDGVLTGNEISDIRQVAMLLGIDDDSLHEALQEHASSSAGKDLTTPVNTQSVSDSSGFNHNILLPEGALIVLTGDMSKPRSDIEAILIARGYRVGAAVTKKTVLVIAADPYTQSGKANKARSYGIPVLSERDGLAFVLSVK